jgi:hypothetical protein
MAWIGWEISRTSPYIQRAFSVNDLSLTGKIPIQQDKLIYQILAGKQVSYILLAPSLVWIQYYGKQIWRVQSDNILL